MLANYPPAISARNEIGRQKNTWSEQVSTLQRELREASRQLSDTTRQRSSQTHIEEVNAVLARQQELARLTVVLEDKATQLEIDTMQPVLNALNTALTNFAARERLTLLFGTVAGGNILYAVPSLDKTDAFLQFLQAQSP